MNTKTIKKNSEQKIVTNGTNITTTDYLDGFQTEERGSRIPVGAKVTLTSNNEQYLNGVLLSAQPGSFAKIFLKDFLTLRPPHAEGYVKNTVVSGQNTYDYVYNYTDHLDERNQSTTLIEVCERSSIRVSYAIDPLTGELDILEENHYYPFGLKHRPYAGKQNIETFNQDTEKGIMLVDNNNDLQQMSLYKYKYNGKELQDELGLNVYAYGWRDYDPAIGRFNKIDRFAEKYHDKSPYNYATNNPVRFVDVKGDSIWITGGWNEKSKAYEYTINVTGKVLDLSQKSNKQAKEYAMKIENLLYSGLTKSGKIGGVDFKFSAKIDITAAYSMDDVSSNDHLLVIVDDVGGDYGVASEIGGMTAYVEDGWFSGPRPDIGIHELGHLFGLKHNWEDDLSDSNSDYNYMSYGYQKGNTLNSFSLGQLNTILGKERSGKLNQGSNSQKAPYSQTNYLWHTSSPSQPWLMDVKKGDVIPTIIPGY